MPNGPLLNLWPVLLPAINTNANHSLSPLPNPCCRSSALELVPLTQRNLFKSVLMDAGRGFFSIIFFFWREGGSGGGLFMGRLSEVSGKAQFCVGKLRARGALHTLASAHKRCQWSIIITMKRVWVWGGGCGGVSRVQTQHCALPDSRSHPSMYRKIRSDNDFFNKLF